jgi:GxxExxY protein
MRGASSLLALRWGPGLIEEIYKKCLGRECELRNIPYVKELRVFLEYKGLVFEESLRLDILIDDVLILELKAVEKVLAHPQGSAFELHEITQQACGSSDKLSRARSKKWDSPDGPQNW